VTQPMLVDELPDVKLSVCEPVFTAVQVAVAFVFWKLRPDESD